MSDDTFGTREEMIARFKDLQAENEQLRAEMESWHVPLEIQLAAAKEREARLSRALGLILINRMSDDVEECLPACGSCSQCLARAALAEVAP